jgi:hypothetical protein
MSSVPGREIEHETQLPAVKTNGQSGCVVSPVTPVHASWGSVACSGGVVQSVSAGFGLSIFVANQ